MIIEITLNALVLIMILAMLVGMLSLTLAAARSVKEGWRQRLTAFRAKGR